MNRKQIQNSDYERASKQLSKLIDADCDVAQQINNCIQHYGVVKFFTKLDTFEFSPEIVEKLRAVKVVLYGAKGGVVHG